MMPRTSNLTRVKRICGYLYKTKKAAIEIRTSITNYYNVQKDKHDWSYSVYFDAAEEILNNIPCPRGDVVILSHYVDANLLHDLMTGRSVLGILHFINQTPIDWFTKKQASVETATHCAESLNRSDCWPVHYTMLPWNTGVP